MKRDLRKTGWILAAAACWCLLVVASAGARINESPTQIDPLYADGTSPTFTYVGVVKSTSGKCVVDRSVQLFDANNGQVYDTDRTSTSGTWAVTGENDASAGNLEVKALRRKVGRKHHRRICQAAVAGIAF